MASSIKGITIEIGGNTTRLQDALKDVDKKSKDLQNELKQVDKLLKLDPHNTELLAQKQELLTQSVAGTSEKLKTLTIAQRQANEQFERGDISAEQYRALTREVEQTTQTLEEQEKALKKIRAQTAPLVQDFQQLGDDAAELSKKLAPMSTAAGAVAAGMAGVAVAAGKFADDINTMSKVTGIATDDLQKFQYASDLIDVSIEALADAMKTLTTNMSSVKSGNEELSSAFATLGVNIYGAGGKLRDNEDVMNETITALGKVTNETERDALAMKIFGESAQQLNPLILGGADALKQLGQEAEQAGLIMSQDALDAANEFNDELDKLKATASGTFMQIGTEIAIAFLPMMQDLSKALQGFLEMLRSLDPEFIRIIGTILLLVAGVAPLLMIIGQVSTGMGVLMKILPYLGKALLEVGGAFKTIFAVLMANPIVAVIAAITALVVALWYLYDTNEDVRAAIDGLWESLKATFSRFLDFMQNIFAKDWSEQFGALGEIMNGAIKKWADIFENAKKIFSAVIEFIKAVFTGDWKAAWTAVKDIFAGVFSLIGDIAKAPLNAIIGYLNAAIGGINTLLEGINKIKFDVPEWVPKIGGKQFGFNIPEIPKVPLLARGGELLNGQAIIAEAGPELLQMRNNRAIVTPLTTTAQNLNLAGAGATNITIYANVPDYAALQSIITRAKTERQSIRRGVVK